MEGCSSLPNNDIARKNTLPYETEDTQPTILTLFNTLTITTLYSQPPAS